MWFTSSSGRIEFQLTRAQAAAMSHPGPCDADVAYYRNVPVVKKQLAKIDPADLARELKEYGAWDEKELADHDANLSRILWIAAINISEELAQC